MWRLLAILILLAWPAALSAGTNLHAPTHVGEWGAGGVIWHSTYFEHRLADWRLEFATPLPPDTEVELAADADWDEAAELEVLRTPTDEIVGVQHHGIPTRAKLVVRLPRGFVEPPLTPGSVHRVVLRGARVESPQPPLEAHLRRIRHASVTDADIDRFDESPGLPIYIVPDEAYLASGGLAVSVKADGDFREQRVTALAVGLTGFVVLLLVIGTHVSRRARREQLAA